MRAAHALIAARRLPRGAGRRGGRRRRRGDRQRVPPLPVEGRPVRRGVPARLAARGRRDPRRGAAAGGPRAQRLAAAVETFARRALRGRRLAWALLAEPVDPAVEAERLAFRRAYAADFAASCATASPPASCAPQNVELAAAALVGALGEALVGPLSPVADDADADALVADLVTFCLRAVTEETTDARPTSNATHEVLNQVPPLEGRNLFADHAALQEALEREGGGWADERLHAAGAFWGGEPMRWGVEANEHPPVLHTHDRFGHRRDEVEFHPSWHALMRAGVEQELHALPWRTDQPGAHVARAATYVCSGAGRGGLRLPDHHDLRGGPGAAHAPDARRGVGAAPDRHELRPRAQAGRREGQRAVRHGDDREAGRLRRARQHDARELAGDDGWCELTGHKWFCSAPMCDLFLVLAQTDEGVTCFALPRVLPDGSRNAGFQLQRLKDKLGNRSNASSEIELRGALARAGRRAGARRADDHRDGQPHAPGLRHRRRRPGCAPRSPRRRGTPRTAARSASAWPTSR